jgi:hypothetical protein
MPNIASSRRLTADDRSIVFPKSKLVIVAVEADLLAFSARYLARHALAATSRRSYPPDDRHVAFERSSSFVEVAPITFEIAMRLTWPAAPSSSGAQDRSLCPPG